MTGAHPPGDPLGNCVNWMSESKCVYTVISVVSESLQSYGLSPSVQSMGFARQEYWSGLQFPSPGDLTDPGIEPDSPALWADSLLSELPGKFQMVKVNSFLD